ncbi:FecR family protein [Winogradskyella flava]|uniref:FecR family protein n=1 Tax=Winogradskyella flava TaxID=1884876 RepID=A0A842IV75_9FLAO|nr:FecR family protein [Winogradskyella flava]MBC2844738.1 FecR family protein [Winogradskyella flava]
MDKEYLVKKWLSDELSQAEETAFKAMDDASLYEDILQEAQRYRGEDYAKVVSFEELDKHLTTEVSNSDTNWRTVAMRIAAVFVIGLALFTVFNQNNIQSFDTDLAQTENIILPDNSVVSLNELSHLEYNASKWDEKRTLELKGEAFFDVEKGERFDVHTEFGTVSVLGTEFNVISKDGTFKVSCYEGLVSVNYGQEEVKLPAGTEFTLTSGDGIKTNISISEPNWLKNMSVFDNASLDAVLAELEKQYDVNINYVSDNDTIINFTGAFEHNNLENALKSVTQALNLTYTINSQEVEIKNAEN